MGRFKRFLKSRNHKKKKGLSYPSSINNQNYTNVVNYINTPPYGTPPQVGGITDGNFPGYPSA